MGGIQREQQALAKVMGGPPAPRGARRSGSATAPAPVPRLSEHLLLQIRPAPGARLERECLSPPGVGSLSFGYLGDLQLRFVFDQPGVGSASLVRTEDLARLDLNPTRAMAHALANLRRLGAPTLNPTRDGVYQLRATHPAYSGVHLLDRTFWREQLQKFPQGLLAALPVKGVLLFAPAGDPLAAQALEQQAGRLRAQAGPAAQSALVYRFDASGWAPHADLPAPPAPPPPEPAAAAAATANAAGDAESDEEDSDDGLDLDKAATGQRMLILSIVAGFIVNASIRSGLPPWVILALTLTLTVYSLVGVVRLSSGLGKSTGITILCMVLTFFPLINLVTWIVLSVQATRALRAAGWRVGLLGAKP